MNSFRNVLLLSKKLGLVLFAYFLCRLLFLLFNFSYFSELPFYRLFSIFVFGIRFDISAIVVCNSLFIILYLVPFKYREKNRYRNLLKWLFVSVNSIAILANCVDLAYFKFTLKRTTFSVFKFFNGEMGNDFYSLIPSFVIDFWYVPLIWILITIALYFAYKKVASNCFFIWNKKEYLRQFGIFILVLLISVLLYRGGFQLKPIGIITAGEYAEAKYIPLLINTPFSIIKTSDMGGLEPHIYYKNESEMGTIYSPYHPEKNEKFSAKNVVIIILESFSKEYIGSLNGQKKGYTPFLDSLIGESLVFTNAYSNGKTSIEGIPAIIAGMPTWMDEPYITSLYGSNELYSLAALLKNENYSSAFFHGGTNGTMGFDAFSKISGYDKYYGKNEFNNEKEDDGNWGIWDEPFLQFASNKTSELPQPFVTTIFTLSSHHPFNVPDKYKQKFKEGDLPIHKTISYTDYALRKFFDSAKKTAWFKNTLFVFSADHTSISVDPFYTNKVGNNAIPIFYYFPYNEVKGKNSTLTQQIDIMPTVLDLLNYPKKYFGFGVSAIDSTSKHFVLSYSSGISQLMEDGYILEFNGNNSTGFYNLNKDSLLSNNLINNKSIIKNTMEQKVKAILQTYQQALIKNKTH